MMPRKANTPRPLDATATVAEIGAELDAVILLAEEAMSTKAAIGEALRRARHALTGSRRVNRDATRDGEAKP